MKTAMKRLLVSTTWVISITLLLGGAVASFSGCGTVATAKREAKTLYKGTDSQGTAYRKTVAARPFENDVPWVPADFSTTFMPLLRDAVEKESDRLRVLLPEDTDFPGRFNQTELLGAAEPDSHALAAAGRDAGANMILTAKLSGIRHETEDRGMFWFAKVVHVARIQMQISIVHSGTGAVLLDRSVFHSIDITEAAGSRIDDGEMPDDLPFEDALSEISETMGKLAGNVLRYIPWEGYVSRMEGDRVTLSAGQYSGLETGEQLAVYDTVSTTGDNGRQQFIIPGGQIGSITVTAVYDDHSDAVATEGGPFSSGNIVK